MVPMQRMERLVREWLDASDSGVSHDHLNFMMLHSGALMHRGTCVHTSINRAASDGDMRAFVWTFFANWVIPVKRCSFCTVVLLYSF